MAQFETVMVRQARGDGPFRSPETFISSDDPVRFCEMVDRARAQGYVDMEDVEQTRTMLAVMRRKRDRELSKPYVPDPAGHANKASGKGMAPYRKPYYEKDKRVASAWEPIRTKW
jgi:hypothetical protein